MSKLCSVRRLRFLGWALLIPLLVPCTGAGETLRVRGITTPIRDSALSAKVDGTVSTLIVAEGDVVSEGDVILELDKVQETLEVERRLLVWQDQSEILAASNRLETLRRDLASTRQLYETTKSVSRDELDSKELEVALADADVARLGASELREGLEYRMAEEQLRRRDLTAPMSGTVVSIDVEVGEFRETRQPMVRLVDTSRLYFVANVTEPVGRHLHPGQPARLEVGVGPDVVVMTGTVCFASATIDPASGLLAVKAEFDNREGRVRPGVAAELVIEATPHGD